MKKLTEEEKHIDQLLHSKDRNNVELGIQLLCGTRNADSIYKFIKGGYYVDNMLKYRLSPFLRENPEVWEKVKAKLDAYITKDIERWMTRRLLEIKAPNMINFCALANQMAEEYFGEFPLLSEATLTKRDPYFVGCTHTGESIKEGIGWSFMMDERDIGPAETIHEEDWEATAHHPSGKIKIFMKVTNHKIIWLEEMLD